RIPLRPAPFFRHSRCSLDTAIRRSHYGVPSPAPTRRRGPAVRGVPSFRSARPRRIFRRSRTRPDVEAGRWPHQQGKRMRTLSTGPIRLALFAIVAGILIACRTDTIAAPSDSPIAAKVVDQNASTTYGWHAGDAYLPPLVPPDVAAAASGDHVILTGTGTLGLHPKFA